MMGKAIHSRNRQKGYTLMEMALGAVIVAILAIVMIPKFIQMRDAARVDNESQQLTTIVGKIEKIFARQSNYTGLNNTVARTSAMVPGSMEGSGATDIKTAWSDTGLVFGTAGSGASYTLTYSSVPQAACVQLISDHLDNFDTVAANSTSVTTVAAASTACSSADNNTIVFTGS